MDDEERVSDAVNEAIAGELALMDPAVRASRSEAVRLLDPEYVEIGASGRHYTYEHMLAWLPEHVGSAADGPCHVPSGITGIVLAPGLVQLRYETDSADRRVRRTSLWRKRDEETGWRMFHHQGTVVPPDVE